MKKSLQVNSGNLNYNEGVRTRLIFAFLGVALGSTLSVAQSVEPTTTRLEPKTYRSVKVSTFGFLPQINDRVSVRLRPPRHKFREPLPTGEPNTLPVGGLLSETRGVTLSKFPAIGFTGWRPPDPHGAAGPNHIVGVVNSSLAFFDKSGTPQFQQDFDTFFDSLFTAGQNKFIFDPKVLYDRGAQRFVVLALDQDTATQRSRVLLAVSDDSNPNGNWNLFPIDVKATVSGAACWGDYPGFGYNKDGYVIGLNMFSFSNDSFRGVQLAVIRKSSVLTAGTAVVTSFLNTSGDSFTIQPAETFDNSISKLYCASSATTSQIKIWTLDNLGGAPTTPTTQLVTVPTHVFPDGYSAPSANGRQLDELDGRLINTVYRGGKIVTVHTIKTTTDSRNRVRWYEFNQPAAGAATLDQSGDIVEPTSANNHFHCAAITKNASGDIGVIFTRSGDSGSIPPGTNIAGDIMRTARKSTDPAGTMGAPVLVQSSAGSSYGFSGINRWGDYASITVDPVDDTKFWAMHMNGGTGTDWKTEIFSFVVTPGLDNLTFSSSQAFGGGTSPTGTITLTAPATTLTTVSLSSNNTSLLTVPATSVFSVGQQSRFFTCGMVGGVNANTPVTVTASLNSVNRSAVITLLPANLSAFTLASTTITANNTTVGTLTLNGKAGASGRAVTVTSNNAIAYSLSPITVPSGSNTTNFTVFTRNTLVTVVATFSATLGSTISRQLTVIMPPPLVAFTINPTTIKGGSPVWSTARIQLVAPTSGVLVRYLETSSNVIMPTSALIPQGKDRVNVQIFTTAVATTTPVTIEARLNGVIKPQTLTLTP